MDAIKLLLTRLKDYKIKVHKTLISEDDTVDHQINITPWLHIQVSLDGNYFCLFRTDFDETFSMIADAKRAGDIARKTREYLVGELGEVG